MIVRMWEATCPAEALEPLTAWLRDEVAPGALESGALAAEAFVGVTTADGTVLVGEGQPRLVLITRWADVEAMAAWDEGAGRDVTRSHAWTFQPL